MKSPPWEVMKGRGLTDAWQEVADKLKKSSEKDGQGKLIFSSSLSGNTVRNRFEKIANGLKKWMKDAPWRSGNDDEADDQDGFVQLVEEVVGLCLDHQHDADAKTEQEREKKKFEKEGAEALKDAALGKLKAHQVKDKANRRKSGGGEGESGRSTPASADLNLIKSASSSSGFTGGDLATVIESTEERASKQMDLKKRQLEIKKAKEERKRQALGIKEEETKMRKQEMEIRKQKQELDAALQKQQMEQQAQQQAMVLEMMRSMTEFVKSNNKKKEEEDE